MVEPTLTSEDVARAKLLAVLPHLANPVRRVMLADSGVQEAIGFPAGDFIRLFEKRFNRQALFDCLRNLANGVLAPLTSEDGEFTVHEATLEADGSAILKNGEARVRIAYIALLSDSRDRRMRILEELGINERLDPDRSGQWYRVAEAGPLDSLQFRAFENDLKATPESIFATIKRRIDQKQLKIDDLVPTDSSYYYGKLFGLKEVPTSLATFRASWVDRTQSLDEVRLHRQLKLCAPLSILEGGLIGQMSEALGRPERYRLVDDLSRMPDLFSILAAFEIAGRYRDEAGMKEIADGLVRRLCVPSDSLIADGAPAFLFAMAITTAVTARARTFSGWSLGPKRLARVVHASLLVQVLEPNLDRTAFEGTSMASLSSTALLADLCDCREAPIFQFRYHWDLFLHGIALGKSKQIIDRIEVNQRPASWVTSVNSAISTTLESGRALFVFAPLPFAEFEEDFSGLHCLDIESVQMLHNALDDRSTPDPAFSALLILSVSTDLHPELRTEFWRSYMNCLRSLDGDPLTNISSCGLHIAARWRDISQSDAIIDILLHRATTVGLPDTMDVPALILMGAAAEADRSSWLKRVGRLADAFAFAQRGSEPAIVLLNALDVLQDVEPDLIPYTRSARSFALLTYNRIPPDAISEPHFESGE